MAASTRSFGMFTARAFWITRRSVGFEAGSGPPDFTDIVMSLAMRANCFAMRFHRANIVCLRTSKIRPMRHPDSIGKNRRRFFRYRACVYGGKKRGFCRLPRRVATLWPAADGTGLRGAREPREG